MEVPSGFLLHKAYVKLTWKDLKVYKGYEGNATLICVYI